MIKATLIIDTLPNGMVYLDVKTDQRSSSANERLLAGVVDVALNKAGEMIMEHTKSGQMIAGADIEKYIAPAIANALRRDA
jgi:hypothetical protein